MLVITAIVGNSFRNDRSLSSASATMNSPLAEPRVAAEGAQPPADHRRRIESGALEHQRDHRRRRRLAVRAGDRDREAQPHQLGEHLGPRNHRDLPRARASTTSGFVGRTADETTTTSASPTCAASCPSVDADAERRQPIGHRRSLLVRSADRRSRDSPAARRCRSCRCRRCRRSARAASCLARDRGSPSQRSSRSSSTRSTITLAASGRASAARRRGHPARRSRDRRAAPESASASTVAGQVLLQQHLRGAGRAPAPRRSCAGDRRSRSAAESESPPCPPP